MNKLLKAFISFSGLRGSRKKDVILIVMIYLRVSCLIRCNPLRRYYHKYFLHDQPEPFDFAPYRKDIRLINKVIAYMPGKHTCLKESLVVHLFFKRKGLHVPLYLGVNTDKEFLAHAWYDQRGSDGYHQVNVE